MDFEIDEHAQGSEHSLVPSCVFANTARITFNTRKMMNYKSLFLAGGRMIRTMVALVSKRVTDRFVHQ